MVDDSLTQELRASNAVRFMESMKAKMELLMRTGDTAQGPGQGARSNQPIVTDPKEEQRLIEFVLKKRKEGLSWASIAEHTPWKVETMTDLLRRRGLHNPIRTTEERKAKREKILELARKVHALRPEKSIPQAIAIVGGITADQYQRARGELNLPIPKKETNKQEHN